MDFDLNTFMYGLAIWTLPVLFAITLHEVAHGWMAYKLGDSTAKMLGRLSLNPIRHIDPVGTVAVPALLLLIGAPFLFGWAKPVPVSFRNLKNDRKDMVLVAVAGPAANLLMAVGWMVLLSILYHFGAGENPVIQGFQDMAQAGVSINLILLVFNLLPIPPLDGGRVLTGIVPNDVARILDSMEPYGMIIVIALMSFGWLNTLISPLIGGLEALLGWIFL